MIGHGWTVSGGLRLDPRMRSVRVTTGGAGETQHSRARCLTTQQGKGKRE
jgi:hypothetical protein